MLIAPENPIKLPEDIQKAVDQAQTNVIIMEGQVRSLKAACNSLGLEIQAKVEEKMHLEDRLNSLINSIGSHNITNEHLVELEAKARTNLIELDSKAREITAKIAEDQNKLNSDRKALDLEIEIVAKQKADLAIRESKLAADEEAHKVKVQKLLSAIS